MGSCIAGDIRYADLMPTDAMRPIGPYQVIREIGRGGMGVVYLATDTRLDRQVAVKSLPEHLANDPDRLARFQREAKVLASLNHRNIGSIYGIEEVEGRQYLVLEFIEGETLDERLRHGPIPVDEAAEYAVQIAEALETAHEKGVIHRDLKPGNLMITGDGIVKVLDFGLARTTDASPSSLDSPDVFNSPTIPANSPTIPGAIMGTAGYMSPEQARGRPVDKRSDIFAFGCVLFEMLSGDQPFRGETVADSIGATLHKEPDLSQLPQDTPLRVRKLLQRCLVKNKRDRLHDIADARIELQHPSVDQEVVAHQQTGSKGWLLAIAGAAAVLAIAIVTAAIMYFFAPAPMSPIAQAQTALPVFDAEIVLDDGDRLAHRFSPGLAISHDGRMIAFPVINEPALDNPNASAEWGDSRGLMIRHLDQPRPIPISGTGEGSQQPVFSPDGGWIAFVTGLNRQDIYKIPVTGGQAIKIGSAPSLIIGLAWSDDGRIFIGQLFGHSILQVPATGGPITPLTSLDASRSEDAHGLPHLLPDRRGLLHIAYSHTRGGDRTINTWVYDFAIGERRLLIEDASHPQYANGHIVFIREGALMAVPFDVTEMRITGGARLVGASVVHSKYFGNVTLMTAAGQFAIARNGTMAMAEGTVPAESPFSIVWVDQNGDETPLDIEHRFYLTARIMEDGERLFLSSAYGPTRAVWLHELDRGVSRRLFRPSRIWAIPGPGPDDITSFLRDDTGQTHLGFLPIGGGAASMTRIVMPEEDDDVIPVLWTPDGRSMIAFGTVQNSPDVSGRVGVFWIYERDDGWRLLTDHRGPTVLWPALSPDGRWLAFTSIEAGAWEVHVRPLHESGPVQQVSVGGGSEPAWSPDGSKLYYRTNSDTLLERRDMMVVSVAESSGRLHLSRPERLFTQTGFYIGASPIRSWDIAADGRFLFVKAPPEEQQREFYRTLFPDRIRVIQNWAARLDR